MIEYNRMGYSKKFDVYETYYMATQAIRREEKKPIANEKEGIKEIYTWKVIKVNVYTGKKEITAYRPILQLSIIKEELL